MVAFPHTDAKCCHHSCPTLLARAGQPPIPTDRPQGHRLLAGVLGQEGLSATLDLKLSNS